MYEDFYGLRERPFDLTANPKYLLLTPVHEEALSSLEYGISTGNGITLLLGEAGTGKTTLIRKVLSPRSDRVVPFRITGTTVRWAYVTNPRLGAFEFLELIGRAFHLDPAATGSKTRFLHELERNLVEHRERGILSVLVADEAQGLPDELLEEVRLLANIETDTEKLLRVVLAGQPALADRLNEHGFRQLKQRIGLRCTLPPLDLRSSAVYIAHRIRTAGGNPGQAFSREAVITIYERSQGIPRIINVICHNALLTGFAADQRPVRAEIVLEVCRDFDLNAITLEEFPPPLAVPPPTPEPVAPMKPQSARTAGALRPAVASVWRSLSAAGNRR